MTAESANFKVGTTLQNKISDYERALRKATNLRPIYFDQVVNYINNRVDDDVVREKVMAVAKRYPHSALHRFVQNFDMIYSACMKETSVQRNLEVQQKVKPVKKLITTDELLDLHAETDDEIAVEDQNSVEKVQEDVQNIVDFQTTDEVGNEPV